MPSRKKKTLGVAKEVSSNIFTDCTFSHPFCRLQDPFQTGNMLASFFYVQIKLLKRILVVGLYDLLPDCFSLHITPKAVQLMVPNSWHEDLSV